MNVTLTKSDAFKIHYAIHAGDDEVKLSNGSKVPVTLGKNKCRECVIFGWRFMEQNRTKTTQYAKMSRDGKRVTWIINPMPRAAWGLLIEDKIEKKCPLVVEDEAGKTTPITPMAGKQLAAEIEKKSVLMKRTVTRSESDEEDDDGEGSDADAGGDDTKKAKVKAPSKKKTGSGRTFTLEVEFPHNWSTPFNKHQQIELKPVDDLWKWADALMNKTLSSSHKERYGYSKVQIKKLIRLQNPDLWNHYYLRKKEIAFQKEKPVPPKNVLTDKIDASANEYYLFHGLNWKFVENITDFGFDERVSNLAGMFGCGIYFAENCSKSIIYTHAKSCAQVGAVYAGTKPSECTCCGKNDVERVMFITRVCLGRTWIRTDATDKDKPLRRPYDEATNTAYDSVLGESIQWDKNSKLMFREYIVYDRRQCYPEFVVHFSCKK